MGWFAGFQLGYRLSQYGLWGRRIGYLGTSLLASILILLPGGSPENALFTYLLLTFTVSTVFALLSATASRSTHEYSTRGAIAYSLLYAGIAQLFAGGLISILNLEGVVKLILPVALVVLGLLAFIVESQALIPPALLDAVDELGNRLSHLDSPMVRSLVLIAVLTVASSYSRLWTRYACTASSIILYTTGGFSFSLGALIALRIRGRLHTSLIPLVFALSGFIIGRWCVDYVVFSLLTGYYAGLGYVSAYYINPLRLSVYSGLVGVGLVSTSIIAALLAELGLLHVLGLLAVLVVESAYILITPRWH